MKHRMTKILPSITTTTNDLASKKTQTNEDRHNPSCQSSNETKKDQEESKEEQQKKVTPAALTDIDEQEEQKEQKKQEKNQEDKKNEGIVVYKKDKKRLTKNEIYMTNRFKISMPEYVPTVHVTAKGDLHTGFLKQPYVPLHTTLENPNIEDEEITMISAALLKLLDMCNKNKLIHGDMVFQNIFINVNTYTELALIDFGMSMEYGDDSKFKNYDRMMVMDEINNKDINDFILKDLTEHDTVKIYKSNIKRLRELSGWSKMVMYRKIIKKDFGRKYEEIGDITGQYETNIGIKYNQIS